MLNRTIIVGRLTKDVELRKTNSGVAVASATIAFENAMSNADGSRGTCFLDVVIWQQLAETCAKSLHKGSLVAIDGRLNQRSYPAKDGTKRQVIEVIAENVRFLEKKQDDNAINEEALDQAIDELEEVAMAEKEEVAKPKVAKSKSKK